MSYKKYYIYKEQYSVDGGQTWVDTGNETTSGDPIGSYETLEECEGYSPYYYSFTYTMTDNTTGKNECSSSSAITPTEINNIDESHNTLKSVVVGECVESINNRAFSYPKALLSVDMSNSNITTIGDNAFSPYWVPGEYGVLTAVTFSPMLTTIGEAAFRWCKTIRTFDLPNTVTSIGQYAFSDCTSLYDISSLSGTSVTKINHYTFSGCTSLTKIELPTSCQEIGYFAFRGCTSLRNFDLKNVTTIGSSAFYGCTSLSSITFANGTTSIPTSCFNRCSGLTSVTIPNSVITIGSDAFAYCSQLSSVTLSNSLLTIDYNAFVGCNSLTSCTIPSSVISIGNRAFNSDSIGQGSSLTYIECLSTIPPTLGTNVFNGSYPIYVPDGSVEDYKAATNWIEYIDRIKPISEKP